MNELELRNAARALKDAAEHLLLVCPEPKQSEAKSSPEAAPERATRETDWVNCPVCGETDMRKEIVDEEGHALIYCVNHACLSNGGEYQVHPSAVQGEERTALRQLVAQAYPQMEEQQKASSMGYNFWDDWRDRARPIYEQYEADKLLASSSPTATAQTEPGERCTDAACIGYGAPLPHPWQSQPPAPAPECAHDWVVIMATEGGDAPLDWNPIRRELAQCRSCLKWSFCGLLLVPYNTAPSLPTEGEGR